MLAWQGDGAVFGAWEFEVGREGGNDGLGCAIFSHVLPKHFLHLMLGSGMTGFMLHLGVTSERGHISQFTTTNE